MYEYDWKSESADFLESIEDAIKSYGYFHLMNKVARRSLWEKALEFSRQVRKRKLFSTSLMNILLSFSLVACAEKVTYAKEFSVLVWKDEDGMIKADANRKGVGIAVQEITTIANWMTDVLRSKISSEERVAALREYFLSVVLWRCGWAYNGLKEMLARNYQLNEIRDYDIFRTFGEHVHPEEMGEILGARRGEADFQPIEKDIPISIYVCTEKHSDLPKSRYLKELEMKDYSAEGFDVRRYGNLGALYEIYSERKTMGYCGFWRQELQFASLEEMEDGRGMEDGDILLACNHYDIVAGQLEQTRWNEQPVSVYEYFKKNYCKKDIDAAIAYIAQEKNSFYNALSEVLFDEEVVMEHIFFMRYDLLQEYGDILFPVLKYIDKNVDTRTYTANEYRSFEFLACIMLTAFLGYLKETGRGVSVLHQTYKSVEIMFSPIVDEKPEDVAEKNLIPICLACDNAYIKNTAVLLQSILANTREDKFYDIFILHRDISPIYQGIILRNVENIKNVTVRFLDISSRFKKYENLLFISRHLSLETYYRFMILDIFPEYEKVLYLDSDMIVDGDISELFQENLGDNFVAAARDMDFITRACENPIRPLHADTMRALDFDDWTDYFNAGVILFNLKEMRKVFTTESMFQVALSRHWSFHDQDVLNCIFHGRVHYLDGKWNFFWYLAEEGARNILTGTEPEFVHRTAVAAMKERKIIHYTGDIKPWNKGAFELENPTLGVWWHYARQSVFYEDILVKLQNEDVLPRMWYCVRETSDSSKGWPAFALEITPDDWCSNYAVIDVMFLANSIHAEEDTLRINVRKKGSSELEIMFAFDNSAKIFEENIGYVLENGQLIIWCRYSKPYTGYSFNFRSLESRNFLKPKARPIGDSFVTKLVTLPKDWHTGKKA